MSTVGAPAAARQWRAKWIWAPGPGTERNVYYHFRTEFELPAAPRAIRLFITADTRYQLFINGALVGRGAPPSMPFHHYYDERDVAPHVRPGANCIGVIAYHMGISEATRGGLLAELVDADGRVIVKTDQTWRVTRAHAWKQDTFCVSGNRVTPFQEVFDARKAIAGWSETGFDDTGWRPAVVLTGRQSDRPPSVPPWTRLVPRDIPFMRETDVLPERIEGVQEALDIANRARTEDLSISLSMGGRPIEHARCDGPENLCREVGRTVIQCSVPATRRSHEGIYSPFIILDFGRVLTAYPRLDLGGVAGGTIDIGYAERLVDGHFNNAIECQFADRYVMTDGPQVWQPATWKAFRYLKVLFRSCPKPVTVHSIRAIVTSYPFDERGAFRSGDEVLNGAFDIARYTLRLCCNESIVDTPWREQAQWLGDVSAVTLGGIYACFGDAALPAKFLRQCAAQQYPSGLIANNSNTVRTDWHNAIPDYSLWWVMAVWNHYLYTGDGSLVHDLYAVAMRVIEAFLDRVNEYGLVEDMHGWVFIDWADIEKAGECTALNALFYGALEAMAGMARFRGDRYLQQKCEGARTALKASFQERLFDLRRGCFADARIDDAFWSKTSEHASMAAIRFGLCDGQTAAAVISRFYEKRDIDYTEAQPFFTSVVLKALDRAGRFDLALAVVRERWGKRMLDQGATSTFEEWGINGSWRSGEYVGFLRSLSHAWSAAPAEFLIRGLAGLQILGPGCRKVRVAPPEVPFDYDVTFPTPLGPIQVTRANGATAVSLPSGMERA